MRSASSIQAAASVESPAEGRAGICVTSLKRSKKENCVSGVGRWAQRPRRVLAEQRQLQAAWI